MPLIANRFCAWPREISCMNLGSNWSQSMSSVRKTFEVLFKWVLFTYFHGRRTVLEAYLPCFHRLFGGLVLDIKRKAPWYWSDYRDALSLQCLASFLFLYCACMSPVITFGGLLGEATEGRIVRTFNHFCWSQTRLKILCWRPSPLRRKSLGLGLRRLDSFYWVTVIFCLHTRQQHSFPFRTDFILLEYQLQ